MGYLKCKKLNFQKIMSAELPNLVGYELMHHMSKKWPKNVPNLVNFDCFEGGSNINTFLGFSYPLTVRPRKLSFPEYLISRKIGGLMLSIFEKPAGTFDVLQLIISRNSSSFFIHLKLIIFN